MSREIAGIALKMKTPRVRVIAKTPQNCRAAPAEADRDVNFERWLALPAWEPAISKVAHARAVADIVHGPVRCLATTI